MRERISTPRRQLRRGIKHGATSRPTMHPSEQPSRSPAINTFSIAITTTALSLSLMRTSRKRREQPLNHTGSWHAGQEIRHVRLLLGQGSSETSLKSGIWRLEPVGVRQSKGIPARNNADLQCRDASSPRTPVDTTNVQIAEKRKDCSHVATKGYDRKLEGASQ
ncbi:hypothetical protein GE09DRAFT_1104850 [Coniochaeta sp. 2T2.1]|nr:hypothetical protein GE09DRAFT_1104850 [Coniochaeta sp. 2T2.1]